MGKIMTRDINTGRRKERAQIRIGMREKTTVKGYKLKWNWT